jgi:hypothetical protein
MCALIFDQIMPHIDYDKNSDEFYGFATDTPDIKIADHVLVSYTGCPRTGSPEKTGMCRQQKRLQID